MRRSHRVVAAVVTLLATAVPTASPAAPSAPAGGSDVNLVCNAGFESMDYLDCWSGNRATYSTDTSHTGNVSARFCHGADGRCIGFFKQEVRVPRYVTAATVSVWVFGGTSDDTFDCSTTAGAWLVDPRDASDKYRVGACEEMTENFLSEEAAFVEYSDSEGVVEWLQAREGLEIRVWAAGRLQDGQNPVTGDLFVDDVFLSITTAVPHTRDVDLDLRRHLRAKGSVAVADSGAPAGCVAGVTVNVQRKADGRWKRVGSAITSGTGSFAERLPDKVGRYRAVAPSLELSEGEVCARSVSQRRLHRH